LPWSPPANLQCSWTCVSATQHGLLLNARPVHRGDTRKLKGALTCLNICLFTLLRQLILYLLQLLRYIEPLEFVPIPALKPQNVSRNKF
jgi:hypothetical protein